jgi:hypothetical protein
MVAEAMGIEREDKFNKYALWKDVDRIVEDADAFIRQSPFSGGRIVEAIKRIFV